MAKTEAAMAEPRTEVLDYEAFGQPPSQLFLDYLSAAPSAAGFYAGGFDLAAIAQAAQRTQSYPRDRLALSAALVAQQRARGADAAAVAAEQLEDPHSVAIVTGQQAVLFGGPLFVLYKALAVMRVAAALEEAHSGPVVPVFWVASDDHDFAEIRQTTVLDDDGHLRSLRYNPHHEPTGQPASEIALDDTIVGLVDELAVALPAGPNREALIAQVAGAYRPGETIASAFARLLSSWLPGLIVLDPSDPALKRLMAPILSREIREDSPSSQCSAAVAVRLKQAGYHQQVPVREGFFNVFTVLDGERHALGARDGAVEVRGTDLRLTTEVAVARLAADPGAWSPGVLLRPVAQDHLLPTAAYIGGPAEIAYHAQIGPSYERFGVPRPALLPRPSLTLVEAAQSRALRTEKLSLVDLESDPQGIVARWAKESYPDVEAAFARARVALERELGELEATLTAIDPTLGRAAESARGRALHQVGTLHEKSIRALKKRDNTRAERLKRTRDALFPGGSLQERGLSQVVPLARHGESLIREIGARLDPWAKGHQVLFL
jgi:bacillithiol biosynthesis cysteine-adding enzyme BshC